MRARLLVASLAVLLAARAGAQTHPNFAGTWVLDPAKTVNNTQAPTPDSSTRVIARHGDTLIVDTQTWAPGNPQKSHVVWGLDGKPWSNLVPVMGADTPVSTILSWDGATLVITSTLSIQGGTVTQLDRWSLSADGKSLSTSRSVSFEGQDMGSLSTTYLKKP